MLKKYFFAGLLVWVPIWVTLVVLRFVIEVMDNSFSLLPRGYQPDNVLGFHVPGIGMLFALIIIFFTGLIATNFFGKRIVRFWEKMLARIPVVRSIYQAVKQVLETLFSSNSDAFRKVLLVEFPRKEMWTLAFQTSSQTAEKFTDLPGDFVSVYVPTTPNPTSGYLLLVERSQIRETKLSVDEALKMIISLGVASHADLSGETVVQSKQVANHRKSKK